jgi:lipid-A-disaccharide synthase
MVDAVTTLRAATPDLEVVLAVASDRLRASIDRVVDGNRGRIRFSDRPRDVLAACDVNLAASGTVLLEAAVLDAPAIMTYRVDRLTSLYATHVLRLRRALPFLALPNITAGEPVVPELVLDRATAPHLATAAAACLSDPALVGKMRDGYARVRARLGEPGVSDRVAEHLLRSIESGAGRPALEPGHGALGVNGGRTIGSGG